MTGFVDLHCHYLPGVDDGVRSFEEGVALCRALKQIGYASVTATPHIRSAMFANEKHDLERRFAEFSAACRSEPDLPELLLGAEHFCDDVFWSLFERDAILPYSGGKAALIELPQNRSRSGSIRACSGCVCAACNQCSRIPSVTQHCSNARRRSHACSSSEPSHCST